MDVRLIVICHGCRRRQPACAGACVCLEDGVDIIEHARQGACPLGNYERPAAAAAAPGPLPLDEWPAWATAVARRRRPGDAGVGDTVHRRLGRMGRWFEGWAQKLGIPCRCAERREEWNATYPYLLLR